MSEIIQTEAVTVRLLADRVNTARAANPDEARRLLWAIARQHGRQVALDVAEEMWLRTKAEFAERLPDRAA
jgi:phosphoglycerate dehydrogenase-like enzyme